MTVHVAIIRKVLSGKEDEFKEALRRFLGESFQHGGVHGASLLTDWPGAHSREIGILRSFRDETERDAFYQSEQYKKWEEYAATVTEEEPFTRSLSGLEAWFRSPVQPPRWKMAIATFLGVFPTSLFLTLTIGDFLHPLPVIVRSAVFAAVMVALLTWVVMPQIIKILKKWLHSAH